MSSFEDLSKKVKVIVSEVDGVLTEGIVPLDNLNNTLFKFYFLRDFEAVNLLKKHYNFVFLSSDNNVTYNIMRSKNIPFYWAQKSKKDTLVQIMRKYSVGPEEILYIGCNFSDINCVKMIPFSLCPNDAVDSIIRLIQDRKEVYGYDGVLNIYGGFGVISEVYERLLPIIRKNLTNRD